MDRLPLLKINVSDSNEIAMEFEDQKTGVQANPREGSLALHGRPVHPESSPIEHGRALLQALLDSPPVDHQFRAALQATIHAHPPRPLRISLSLPAESRELHDLSWETLLDPVDDQPLLSRHKLYFFRFLKTEEPIGVQPDWPRALVFVANPEHLADERDPTSEDDLQPVEVEEEISRARLGLKPLIPHVIASVPGHKGTASLENLMDALGEPGAEPYHVLYLVCHGEILETGPVLWFDQPDDEAVDAQLLINGLRDLGERRPRLVVLASCQSAGQPGTGTARAVDRGALMAIGPKLVQQAGIAAVVAMQGDVYMRTIEAMMPVFFRQLVYSGQVEQAMAMARARLRIDTDSLIREQWRVPVLFSRLVDGQIWPRRRFKSRTVYLSHALLPTDPEAPALNATRKLLNDAGYEVIDSQDSREKDEPWSQRLLDGLGTCDAAVLLLNEQALTEADNELHVEASILCWRHWLEEKFWLIPLYLGAERPLQLQQVPWSLLCKAGMSELDWTSPDNLAAELQELLEPLIRRTTYPDKWKLGGLLQTVAEGFTKMDRRDSLESAAEELGLLLPDGEAEDWWAKAALCKGPLILYHLYEYLRERNLINDASKAALGTLLSPVRPAWVGIEAAAQIVHLADSGNGAPGCFYLKGIDPLDWIAQSYAARACGLAYDIFLDGSCMLLVKPVVSGAGTDKVQQIRDALRARLEDVEDKLWKEKLCEARGEVWDGFHDPPEPENGDTELVDTVIRLCIESRVADKRPVWLLLPGSTALSANLLGEVGNRFGPLGFFFMGRDPAPASVGERPVLTSVLPPEARDQFGADGSLVSYLSK